LRIDDIRMFLRRASYLVAAGFVAVSCGDPSDTVSTQPSVTGPADTTIAETTIAAQTTAAATSTTAASTTTTASTVPARTRSIWSIPDGIEVAVAGEDGLHLLTGSDDRILSGDRFADVVADPAGDGWLVSDWFEFNDSAAPRSIRRIGNDGSDTVIATPEDGAFLQLHDAGIVDNHATVFFSVNLFREMPQYEVLDQLFAMDLVTGEGRKITDVGGWEMGVNLTYGGGMLAGVWSSEATVTPWSVDLAGNLDPIDVERVGLEKVYSDVPGGPSSLAIAADGSRLTWVTPPDQFDGLQLVSVAIDGTDRREFTLPPGPALQWGLTDRGDYVVLGAGDTASALVDIETGGMLLLPVDGAAAAAGQWSEPPRWAIPSPVTDDATQEIKDRESEWAPGGVADEQSLADALVADDGGGECASQARAFPSNGLGGPFYIELRQFCDDSVAGALYEVTVVQPQADGTITGSATRRTLCSRGVTTEGLCV
jgi:hypothetical protein